VHRQTGVDTPALPPDRPARSEGRYHRPGDPWPLYASLDPATVWAEWSAATRGAIDPRSERRRLWPIEVDDLPVLDLRDETVRRALGVELADLSGPRGSAQAFTPRARALGASGLVVPSAARAEAWNLVVLPEGFTHLTVGRGQNVHPRPPSDGTDTQSPRRRRLISPA
jgi:RES domain-containing protein